MTIYKSRPTTPSESGAFFVRLRNVSWAIAAQPRGDTLEDG